MALVQEGTEQLLEQDLPAQDKETATALLWCPACTKLAFQYLKGN